MHEHILPFPSNLRLCQMCMPGSKVQKPRTQHFSQASAHHPKCALSSECLSGPICSASKRCWLPVARFVVHWHQNSVTVILIPSSPAAYSTQHSLHLHFTMRTTNGDGVRRGCAAGMSATTSTSNEVGSDAMPAQLKSPYPHVL